jgi:hypothetical protein
MKFQVINGEFLTTKKKKQNIQNQYAIQMYDYKLQSRVLQESKKKSNLFINGTCL